MVNERDLRQIAEECAGLIDPLDAFTCADGDTCKTVRQNVWLRTYKKETESEITGDHAHGYRSPVQQKKRFGFASVVISPREVLQKLERMRQQLLAHKSYVEDQLSLHVKAPSNFVLVNAKLPQLHPLRGKGARAAAAREKGMMSGALKNLHGARGAMVISDASERKKKQRQATQRKLLQHVWQSDRLKKEAEPIFTLNGVLDVSASPGKIVQGKLAFRGHGRTRETALQLRLKADAARSISERFRANPNYRGAKEVLATKMPRLGQPLFLTPRGNVRGGGQRIDHARLARYGVKQGMFLQAHARHVLFVKGKKPTHTLPDNELDSLYKHPASLTLNGLKVMSAKPRQNSVELHLTERINPNKIQPLVGSQVRVEEDLYTISVGKRTTGKFQAFFFSHNTSIANIESASNTLRCEKVALHEPLPYENVLKSIQTINICGIIQNIYEKAHNHRPQLNEVIGDDVYIPYMTVLVRPGKDAHDLIDMLYIAFDAKYGVSDERAFRGFAAAEMKGGRGRIQLVLPDAAKLNHIKDPPDMEGIYYWYDATGEVLTKSQAEGVAREYIRNHFEDANATQKMWYTKRTKHTSDETMSPLHAILDYTRERLGLDRLKSSKPRPGRENENPKRLPPKPAVS